MGATGLEVRDGVTELGFGLQAPGFKVIVQVVVLLVCGARW